MLAEKKKGSEGVYSVRFICTAASKETEVC